MTNRSADTSLGLSILYFITLKKRVDKISAQLDDEVGCLQTNQKKLLKWTYSIQKLCI